MERNTRLRLRSRDLACYNTPCSTENANHKCSRCKLARYCSTQCQRHHWPDHKQVCGNIQDFKHLTSEFKVGSVLHVEEQWDFLSDGQLNELGKGAGITFINMRKHLPDSLETALNRLGKIDDGHARYMLVMNEQYVPRTEAEFLEHHRGTN